VSPLEVLATLGAQYDDLDPSPISRGELPPKALAQRALLVGTELPQLGWNPPVRYGSGARTAGTQVWGG